LLVVEGTQALEVPAAGRAKLEVLADDVRDRGALTNSRDVLLADAPSHIAPFLPGGLRPFAPQTPAHQCPPPFASLVVTTDIWAHLAPTACGLYHNFSYFRHPLLAREMPKSSGAGNLPLGISQGEDVVPVVFGRCSHMGDLLVLWDVDGTLLDAGGV